MGKRIVKLLEEKKAAIDEDIDLETKNCLESIDHIK